jgi:two-component system LytT family response regulator
VKIRTLIVDDEAPARARLRQLLRDEEDVEVIAECANGRQAVTAIQQQRPDLVFLDVQMPRLNGLDVCRSLGDGPLPYLIFVTAFDQYALEAFEVHAIDYLLKPFDRERFRKSLRRAREQLRQARGVGDERLTAFLEEIKRPQTTDRLVFKAGGRVVFVRLRDVDWVESDGNYVKVRAGGTLHHLRETLSALEGRLPSDRFMRISRSVIVNVDRIKECQPLFYGDYAVILQDGTRLTLSRNFRDRLENLLSKGR